MISFPYAEFVPARRRRDKRTLKRIPPDVLLEGLKNELEADAWFAQCKHIIDESIKELEVSITDVICLGLGSPSSSRNARVQLAFLLKICDCLLIERHRISIYDPIFSQDDLLLLRELNLTVLSDNENGLHSMQSSAIVYMPHCDMGLYENLLKANWKPDATKLLFIANQLSDYLVNNPLHTMKAKAPYLVEVARSTSVQNMANSIQQHCSAVHTL